MTEYKFVDAGRRYKDQALQWCDYVDEGTPLVTDRPLTTTLGETTKPCPCDTEHDRTWPNPNCTDCGGTGFLRVCEVLT